MSISDLTCVLQSKSFITDCSEKILIIVMKSNHFICTVLYYKQTWRFLGVFKFCPKPKLFSKVLGQNPKHPKLQNLQNLVQWQKIFSQNFFVPFEISIFLKFFKIKKLKVHFYSQKKLNFFYIFSQKKSKIQILTYEIAVFFQN